MNKKELIDLKSGQKVKHKKYKCIFEVSRITNTYDGFYTSEELKSIKPKQMISCKKIKGIDYSYFDMFCKSSNGEFIFQPRELELPRRTE